MRIVPRLRKPQEIIWLLAIILVLVGLLLFSNLVAVPVLAGVSPFWFALAAAVLMILGTWLF